MTSRRRPRREGRRRRRRRSPRAVDPRISRRDPERGQEASVCIAVGAAAAVPVAGFSHRGVWPARIPRCPNLGDVAAIGEHEAVATLGPRVASLTHGRRWDGWRPGRGRRRRIAWRRRRRWPDAAKVEALSPVGGCVPARAACPDRGGSRPSEVELSALAAGGKGGCGGSGFFFFYQHNPAKLYLRARSPRRASMARRGLRARR